MKIIVNDKNFYLEKSISILDFFKYENFSLIGIAISINGNILPKKKWKKYFLKNNDRIEIFKIIVGG
ncbi:sulfur carrier protein ThiS [bacterium endosymbiont of Pedicinus badii]|uniref:sulfur carrier protein ThiS n=1 Tax=bacterium endosymbiont of Pedicinus badii TaxID=1719126 RepID=UPI0009CDD431|nr:sulfur carrier protein ThiS [bacterium endosymbiont of Pedicinus badii]OQM34037.1 hypothetical protein AOQ89_01595 [bacterium endosymbiont of Pedicinus badii]